jgi:fermentation-respiration switch protein FrsA (DUF1100 family)
MTAAAATAGVAATGPAEPRVVEGMNVTRLRFKDADGEVVPVLLCTPAGRTGPFPVVVAVHGLTSHKAQVAAQVAPQLTRRGFAVLCPDMPRHGERPGDPRSVVDRSNLAAAFALGRRAVNDVRQTIDLAERRADLDVSSGVYLVGYSMGSWINSVAGAADPRVSAMVLMVGGAVDIPAMALLLPQVAATDPRLALAHFAGRPLLMLNGRHDPTVPADWASRLFAAAPEPKRQVWYDCGHYLPAEAYDRAAEWLAEQSKGVAAAPGDEARCGGGRSVCRQVIPPALRFCKGFQHEAPGA